jgi:hypothetical protein
MRWLHALLALALNAVPIVGVMAYGWSVPTILVLFWLETLAITLAHCARIALHRRLSRALDAQDRARPVLAGFLLMVGVFSLAQGVFILILAFSAIPREAPNDPAAHFQLAQFLAGGWTMLALVAVDLMLDLLSLRDRDRAWIERETARREGRVILTQLAILGGAFVVVKTHAPVSVLVVLMGFKATFECIGALARPARSPRT